MVEARSSDGHGGCSFGWWLGWQLLAPFSDDTRKILIENPVVPTPYSWTQP